MIDEHVHDEADKILAHAEAESFENHLLFSVHEKYNQKCHRQNQQRRRADNIVVAKER